MSSDAVEALIFIIVIMAMIVGAITYKACTSPAVLNEVETTVYVVTSDPDELEEEVANYIEEKGCVVLKTETVDDRVVVVLRCREEVGR